MNKSSLHNAHMKGLENGHVNAIEVLRMERYEEYLSGDRRLGYLILLDLRSSDDSKISYLSVA